MFEKRSDDWAAVHHPWVSSDWILSHPNSPAGGGGPGMFRTGPPLDASNGYGSQLPHAQSPAARTFAQSTTKSKAPPAVVVKSVVNGVLTPPKILKVSGVVVAGGELTDATIELVNEAAKHQKNKRYIAYEKEVRVGGSIAWRANNPGNLRSASTQIGSAPGGTGKFAVFATLADGRAAQKSLYLTKYGTMAVKDAVAKLTPESENDTKGYLAQLKAAGVDLDKDVKSQIDVLMSAIEASEGTIVGVIVTRVT